MRLMPGQEAGKLPEKRGLRVLKRAA